MRDINVLQKRIIYFYCLLNIPRSPRFVITSSGKLKIEKKKEKKRKNLHTLEWTLWNVISRYFSNDDVAHVGEQTIFIPLL